MDTLGLHLGPVGRISNSSGCWLLPGAGGSTGTKLLLLQKALSLDLAPDRVITYNDALRIKAALGITVAIL